MTLNIFGIKILIGKNVATEFTVGRYLKDFTETRLQGQDSAVELNIS